MRQGTQIMNISYKRKPYTIYIQSKSAIAKLLNRILLIHKSFRHF